MRYESKPLAIPFVGKEKKFIPRNHLFIESIAKSVGVFFSPRLATLKLADLFLEIVIHSCDTVQYFYINRIRNKYEIRFLSSWFHFAEEKWFLSGSAHRNSIQDIHNAEICFWHMVSFKRCTIDAKWINSLGKYCWRRAKRNFQTCTATYTWSLRKWNKSFRAFLLQQSAPVNRITQFLSGNLLTQYFP